MCSREGYPGNWAMATVMVSPQGEIHAIGGDRERGEGDTPYIGLERILTRIKQSEKEVRHLRQWVDDLQSGMYVNCVYCGHRYGPKGTTPASMADILKAHVERCPQHPMSALRRENEDLRAENRRLRELEEK